MADFGRVTAHQVVASLEVADEGRLTAHRVVASLSTDADRARLTAHRVVAALLLLPDSGQVSAHRVVAAALSTHTVGTLEPAASRSPTRGGRALWLLELDFGGGVLRFAEEAVSVTRENGLVLHFSTGLLVQGPARSADQATVSVRGDTDWAQMVARGTDLSAGTGRLLRWVEGTVYERARLSLVGRVEEPEWGEPEEGLEISIVAAPSEDRALVPSPLSRICDETWPVDSNFRIPENCREAVYPIVIGYPGAAGFDGLGALQRSGQSIQAVPAYFCEFNAGALYGPDSKLLIAGHEVAAEQVWIFDATEGTSDIRDVEHTTDLVGRKVAYVLLVASTVNRDETHEYYSAWPITEAGGAYNADRTGALRGAGGVISFLLSDALRRVSGGARSILRFDRGKQAAQAAYLDRYLLDFAITSPVTVADWIRTHLSPILPIRWVEGAGGGYFCAWRYEAVASDRVMHLDADRGQVTRASPLRGPAGERFSRFRFEYAPGAAGAGSYDRRRVLGAPPLPGEPVDPRQRDSWRCAVARSREARRTGGDGIVEWAYRSDVIQDDGTADRILDSLAARYAIPPIPVTYRGRDELETLEIGDVVTITDSAIYLDERVALVADLVPGPDGSVVELEILADPLRERRRTS